MKSVPNRLFNNHYKMEKCRGSIIISEGHSISFITGALPEGSRLGSEGEGDGDLTLSPDPTRQRLHRKDLVVEEHGVLHAPAACGPHQARVCLHSATRVSSKMALAMFLYPQEAWPTGTESLKAWHKMHANSPSLSMNSPSFSKSRAKSSMFSYEMVRFR